MDAPYHVFPIENIWEQTDHSTSPREGCLGCILQSVAGVHTKGHPTEPCLASNTATFMGKLSLYGPSGETDANHTWYNSRRTSGVPEGWKSRTLATKTVDSKFPITLITYSANLPSSEIDKVTQKIYSVNNYAILKSSKEGTCFSVSKVKNSLNFKT